MRKHLILLALHAKHVRLLTFFIGDLRYGDEKIGTVFFQQKIFQGFFVAQREQTCAEKIRCQKTGGQSEACGEQK